MSTDTIRFDQRTSSELDRVYSDHNINAPPHRGVKFGKENRCALYEKIISVSFAIILATTTIGAGIGLAAGSGIGAAIGAGAGLLTGVILSAIYGVKKYRDHKSIIYIDHQSSFERVFGRPPTRLRTQTR